MVAMTVKFPALRGRMGNRLYYVGMVPLSAVPKLFTFVDWAGLPPEARAQRKLAQKRVPEITKYILEHEDDWVFSSLTASFDAEEHFLSSELDADLGVLELPLTGEFLINDGQHRRAAIIEALKENPLLEKQSISVVFFPEENIERNQQMFSDLNRTVQKTSRSIDILYDHRDPLNQVTLAVTEAVPILKGKVDKEAVSLAARSAKFVTLSALYDAHHQLVGRLPESLGDDDLQSAIERAAEFWAEITEHIPEWGDIRDGNLKPSEARAEFVHCHAVGFWALATAGKALIDAYPDEVNWKARLSMLEKIDWRKTNDDWQGICMLGNDIITRRQTREATSKYIQWHLGLIADKPGPVLEVNT
jgi:DNA sulfur modification protein DndB